MEKLWQQIDSVLSKSGGDFSSSFPPMAFGALRKHPVLKKKALSQWLVSFRHDYNESTFVQFPHSQLQLINGLFPYIFLPFDSNGMAEIHQMLRQKIPPKGVELLILDDFVVLEVRISLLLSCWQLWVDTKEGKDDEKTGDNSSTKAPRSSFYHNDCQPQDDAPTIVTLCCKIQQDLINFNSNNLFHGVEKGRGGYADSSKDGVSLNNINGFVNSFKKMNQYLDGRSDQSKKSGYPIQGKAHTVVQEIILSLMSVKVILERSTNQGEELVNSPFARYPRDIPFICGTRIASAIYREVLQNQLNKLIELVGSPTENKKALWQSDFEREIRSLYSRENVLLSQVIIFCVKINVYLRSDVHKNIENLCAGAILKKSIERCSHLKIDTILACFLHVVGQKNIATPASTFPNTSATFIIENATTKEKALSLARSSFDHSSIFSFENSFFELLKFCIGNLVQRDDDLCELFSSISDIDNQVLRNCHSGVLMKLWRIFALLFSLNTLLGIVKFSSLLDIAFLRKNNPSSSLLGIGIVIRMVMLYRNDKMSCDAISSEIWFFIRNNLTEYIAPSKQTSRLLFCRLLGILPLEQICQLLMETFHKQLSYIDERYLCFCIFESFSHSDRNTENIQKEFYSLVRSVIETNCENCIYFAARICSWGLEFEKLGTRTDNLNSCDTFRRLFLESNGSAWEKHRMTWFFRWNNILAREPRHTLDFLLSNVRLYNENGKYSGYLQDLGAFLKLNVDLPIAGERSYPTETIQLVSHKNALVNKFLKYFMTDRSIAFNLYSELMSSTEGKHAIEVLVKSLELRQHSHFHPSSETQFNWFLLWNFLVSWQAPCADIILLPSLCPMPSGLLKYFEDLYIHKKIVPSAFAMESRIDEFILRSNPPNLIQFTNVVLGTCLVYSTPFLAEHSISLFSKYCDWFISKCVLEQLRLVFLLSDKKMVVTALRNLIFFSGFFAANEWAAVFMDFEFCSKIFRLLSLELEGYYIVDLSSEVKFKLKNESDCSDVQEKRYTFRCILRDTIMYLLKKPPRESFKSAIALSINIINTCTLPGIDVEEKFRWLQLLKHLSKENVTWVSKNICEKNVKLNMGKHLEARKGTKILALTLNNKNLSFSRLGETINEKEISFEGRSIWNRDELILKLQLIFFDESAMLTKNSEFCVVPTNTYLFLDFADWFCGLYYFHGEPSKRMYFFCYKVAINLYLPFQFESNKAALLVTWFETACINYLDTRNTLSLPSFVIDAFYDLAVDFSLEIGIFWVIQILSDYHGKHRELVVFFEEFSVCKVIEKYFISTLKPANDELFYKTLELVESYPCFRTEDLLSYVLILLANMYCLNVSYLCEIRTIINKYGDLKDYLKANWETIVNFVELNCKLKQSICFKFLTVLRDLIYVDGSHKIDHLPKTKKRLLCSNLSYESDQYYSNDNWIDCSKNSIKRIKNKRRNVG